jgi:hypothetical protein
MNNLVVVQISSGGKNILSAQVTSWLARSQLTSVQVSVCVFYSADKDSVAK